MNTLTRERSMQMLNKVPEVTIFFWIIKLLAVTVGETAADYLSVEMHFGLTGTSVVMGAVLVIFLGIHLWHRKYVPWIYWVNVVLLSIVGTLITDNLVDNFGVPLKTTTIIFSLALLATFVVWYASERTLSIRTIVTTKRELFYWTAILLTFALGTAGGDLAAEGLNLGYAKSGLVFGVLISVIALTYFFLEAYAILIFWTAYILTRPFGASIGDYLSQPVTNGGFGLGATTTSAIFLVTILSMVIYLTATRKDLIEQRANDSGRPS